MNKSKRIRWIVIYVLIGVLCVCLLYFALDLPSFSPEMAMHRAEARQLVGPSKVTAADQAVFHYYDSFLLGETEHGYCLYEYNDRLTMWDGGLLSYHEKSDTVTCFPTRTASIWLDGFVGETTVMPIFAIPETARAVSASLTLSAIYDGVHYEVSQTVPLRQGEFFLFEMDVTQLHSYVRHFWNYRLNGINSLSGFVSGTATLELFDRQGERIETIVMEFPAII